jgi:hypothetical protein
LFGGERSGEGPSDEFTKRKTPAFQARVHFVAPGVHPALRQCCILREILNGIANWLRLNEGAGAVRSWSVNRGVLPMRPRLIFTVFIAAIALVVAVAVITTVRHISIQTSSTNAQGKTRI